jgi:hypothetical protein
MGPLGLLRVSLYLYLPFLLDLMQRYYIEEELNPQIHRSEDLKTYRLQLVL